MRPMPQTLVLILATKVVVRRSVLQPATIKLVDLWVRRSVLQPATILTCGSVNLCNEINKCTCMKYVSLRD
jgi:hypothetical protein